MSILMDRWYTACSKRSTIRTYENISIKLQHVAKIKEIIEKLTCNEFRMVLLRNETECFKVPFYMSQPVVGADTAVALIASKGFEQLAGSIGEAFVLECTALDIGTSWITSFNRRFVEDKAQLDTDEKVLCLIAIGYSNKPLSCKTANKKDKYDITGLNNERFEALRHWQQRAAECAAIAPTYKNKQKFTLRFSENSVSIVTLKDDDYTEIECGIIMLHIELGASQVGKYGTWEYSNGMFTFTVL